MALLVGGKRAGAVAGREPDIADLLQADRQVALGVEVVRVRFRQPAGDRQVVLIGGPRAGDVARGELEIADLLLADRDVALPLLVLSVGRRQPVADRLALVVGGKRARPVALLHPAIADALEADRQVAGPQGLLGIHRRKLARDLERFLVRRHRVTGVAGSEIGVAELVQHHLAAPLDAGIVRRCRGEVVHRLVDPAEDRAHVLKSDADHVAHAENDIEDHLVDRRLCDVEVALGVLGLGGGPCRLVVGALGLVVRPRGLAIGALRLGGGALGLDRCPLLGLHGVDACPHRDQRDDAENSGGQTGAPGEPLGGIAFDLGLAQLGRLQRPALLFLLRQPLLLGGVGGADILGFLLVEAVGVLDQPLPGAVEHDAGDEAAIAVGLGQHAPVGERPLQPVAADEEFLLLLQPADEQRPHTEQRLMGHLDLAAAVLLAHHQETRLRPGQRHGQPLGALGQRIPARRLADEPALVIDLDQTGDEGLAQRLEFVLARLDVFDHPGGGVAHHRFERRQARGGIAQALVFDELELAVGAELVVEAAQRKGDQRQRVGGARILHDARDQALLDGEIGDARRPADDLAHALDGQRAEGEFLELRRQAGGGLQLAEMVGAQRRDRNERQTRPQQLRQEGEKLLGARRLRAGEQLLHLVDGDEHAGPVGLVALADAARQILRIGARPAHRP